MRAGASRTSVGRQTWLFESGVVGDVVVPLVPFAKEVGCAADGVVDDLVVNLVPLVWAGDAEV